MLLKRTTVLYVVLPAMGLGALAFALLQWPLELGNAAPYSEFPSVSGILVYIAGVFGGVSQDLSDSGGEFCVPYCRVLGYSMLVVERSREQRPKTGGYSSEASERGMVAMRAADWELLVGLFGGLGHPMASRCARQMVVCPRFGVFLNGYRGKIGKKVRSLEGPGSWHDLWLELWTAARLLSDRRFEVAYESYAAQKVRGPDLTATFRTHTICHIEIKHVRAELSLAKWTEVLCTKLGQLPAGAINVLLVGTGAQIVESCSAESAVGELGRAAKAGESTVFQHYGLPGARDFSRHMTRLSGVLRIADWDIDSSARLSLWHCPAARHALPPDLARALLG